MLKAILFDIDDTLYDLSIPFKEAFREFFPGEKMDLEGAFLASRKYSDLICDRSLSGEISMAEMYIYRLGNAFRDYGKIIDGPTALQFQSVYEKRQHEIRMTEEMERMLEELSRKMTLGIIISAIRCAHWVWSGGFPWSGSGFPGIWAWESPIKRFLRQPGKSWD